MNLDSATASLQMRLQQEPGQPARPLLTSENLTAWLHLCGTVLEKVNTYAVKIQSIRNDKTRTLQGQQAQFTALAPQVVKDVGELVAEPLNDAKGAITRLNHLMFDPITAKPKGDAMVIFLREQELRQSIPKTEAGKAYLNALGSDDLETARALLNAPGAPWISDEIKRRGEEAYAQRTNPKALAQRQSLESFQDYLESLAEHVRTWFLALGASPESVEAVLGD